MTTPHDVERIQEIREQSGPARHDRRLRDLRRDPGAAELRRREGVDPARLREPGVHLDARDVDPDRRPREGRPRAARLPDLEGAARRDRARAAQRPPAEASVDERLLRVQGARHAVRDGRPRHAVPRPGHPGRVRRHLPGVQPRLLRLLRPDGEPERRRARGAVAGARRDDDGIVRALRTFNANAPAFREASHERA